jgi:predicted double-glycine peptidase
VKKSTVGFLLVLFLLSELSPSIFAQETSSANVFNVPYYNQEQGYWCGPATLQMVFEFWGVKISQSAIASRVYNQTDNSTNINAMKDYASDVGFNCTAEVGSINKLREFIQKGIPVIVLQQISLNDARGHYRIVVGYDEKKEVFTTFDSQQYENYNITYSQFVDLWQNGTTFSAKNWTLAIVPSWSYSTPSLSPSPSVPEFPSAIIIALIAVSTMTGALLFKRKLGQKK